VTGLVPRMVVLQCRKKKPLTAREIPRVPTCVVRGTDEAVTENVLPSLGACGEEIGYAVPEKNGRCQGEREITRCDMITDLGRKGNKRVYWEPK